MNPAARTAARPVTPSGLIAARLDDLVTKLDATGDSSDFAVQLRDLRDLAVGQDPYLERCASPETPARRQLADRTADHDWKAGHDVLGLEQEMLSGNVEAQTLAMLVRASQARTVLEIGTFSGYAALAMAEALPVGGRLITCERDEATAQFARDAFAASDAGSRIEVRVGPAAETLVELAAAGEVFDLVFVDADKAGYVGYVEVLLGTGLLGPDALLCVDNTLMQGEPWTGADTPNGTAIAAFNEWLANDPRVVQVIVPLRDGLTLACRTRS